MNYIKFTSVMALILLLAACTTNSQNQYSAADTGKQVEVEFGRILSIREVKVQNPNTGAGAVGGGLAGAAAGSTIGSGTGNVYATLGAALVGVVAGSLIEQEIQNKKGIEYTITKSNGKTVTIVQNIAKDDVPLAPGQNVTIQTSGEYQRVMPADNLPDQVKKPKTIKLVD